MLEQQTLFMDLKDISDFTTDPEGKADSKEENFYKTNFDLLVEDFTDSIISEGATYINKSHFIENGKIYCIIGWMNKNKQSKIQKTFPDLTIPDFKKSK